MPEYEEHRRKTEDDALVERFRKSCIIFPHDDDAALREPIVDLASLSERLPSIVTSIFRNLGSQQLESTYQRCLKNDLEEAGLKVDMEQEIFLKYKGKVVGTRRADLIVTSPSGERAVIELKAVDKLKPENFRQLEFYMRHFNADHGILINFPHDAGFPTGGGPDGEQFTCNILLGDLDVCNVHGRQLRLRNDPANTKAQIVEIERRIEAEGTRKEKARTQQQPLDESALYGITQKGTPCKVCIREGGFCRQHKHQATGS